MLVLHLRSNSNISKNVAANISFIVQEAMLNILFAVHKPEISILNVSEHFFSTFLGLQTSHGNPGFKSDINSYLNVVYRVTVVRVLLLSTLFCAVYFRYVRTYTLSEKEETWR